MTGAPETSSLAWQTVTQVAEHLHRDPDRESDLESLARDAGYERTHFAKLFRRVMGQSPARYARHLRLERAALELESTDRPVLQVALRAGYDSGDAFGRAFRRRFGASPSQFRDQVRAMRPWTPAEPPVGLLLSEASRVSESVEGWALPPRSEAAQLRADLDVLGQEAVVNDGAGWWGALSRPWGWTPRVSVRDVDGPVFQAVVCTTRRPIAPPYHPLWVPERDWLLVPWVGAVWEVSDAVVWLHEHGLAGMGLRAGFAPTLTSWATADPAGPLTIRIPVEPGR
jgi:AraC-like DNA-binding protein